MPVRDDIKKRMRSGGDLYYLSNATAPLPTLQETTPQPQQQAQQPQQQAQQPQQQAPVPVTSYADMVKQLTPVLTPEQIEKENRRQRSRKNIAALSDTISAVANLGSAMAGAPNAVEPRQALSAVSKARWEEMKRERERNNQIYHQAMLRAAQLDESRARQEQLARYQQQSIELRNREEDRRQAQERLADRKLDWLQKYQQGLLDVKNEQLEIDREYKAGRISIDEKNAASRALQAQASMMRAQKSGQPRPVQEYETTTRTTTTKPNGDQTTVEKTTSRNAKGGKPAKKVVQSRTTGKISTGVNWKKK